MAGEHQFHSELGLGEGDITGDQSGGDRHPFIDLCRGDVGIDQTGLQGQRGALRVEQCRLDCGQCRLSLDPDSCGGVLVDDRPTLDADVPGERRLADALDLPFLDQLGEALAVEGVDRLDGRGAATQLAHPPPQLGEHVATASVSQSDLHHGGGVDVEVDLRRIE